MGMVDAVAHDLLEYRFGNQATTAPPGNYYYGLSTTTPTDTGGNFTEPPEASYGRSGPHVNNQTTFTTAANREVSNAVIIQFPQAAEDWTGPLTHWGLFSAASGGTPVDWGPLTQSVTILSGQQWEAPVNLFRHQLTNIP